MQKNKIYFDLETTGFDGLKDDLIEIYAIKESPTGEILGDIHLYFNPGISLPVRIVEITKITDAMLKNKPNFISQVDTILDFIEPEDILVGHNALRFDLPFLNQQFIKHNIRNSIQLTNEVIDTMIMARKQDNVGPFTKGYKLIDLANKFNFKINEAKFHGAKYDVEITKILLKALEEKAKPKI
jgi:DNA polymerase-3 subunit alpha (Gram-positive type)